MDSFLAKDKVVIVMGATGSGKSRLSIDLALHFNGEIINSDKIQVYKGLDVLTNKVTPAEMQGVPHHLMSIVEPSEDFTTSDFCVHAKEAIALITSRGRIPIIVGGSNSFVEALVDCEEFRARYECCFLWVYVSASVLHAFVRDRVDQMVEAGLVEEVRGMFRPDADYSKGIQRAIGAPEMDEYLRYSVTGEIGDEQKKEAMLHAAIEEIKENTKKLTFSQLEKIDRLRRLPGWNVHCIDATEAFGNRGKPNFRASWEELVVCNATEIVHKFLLGSGGDDDAVVVVPAVNTVVAHPEIAGAAVAAAAAASV
ncbi:hypothetical protein QJS04_geneDACA017794 [Acorus gramineus]|uniref:adenylate dimethylallyltransferase (ADP/ATP-dependent) n=1 Tax=Acorus gramineus TaxID=55184 RepID=A0AAV9BKX5_ACOGR|nr:hypothetical protein QJS04_geneDACA017794 [Acorus gramineus]